MKTIRCIVCLAGLALLMPNEARAGSPFRGSMLANGYYGGAGNFFNPYSFPSSGSTQTPPYFAVHPPVYYSTRHARPYGMSPFAAPPMVTPSLHYQGRLESEFVRPVMVENPYCEVPGGCAEEVVPAPADSLETRAQVHGPVRENPFITDAPQLAERR